MKICEMEESIDDQRIREDAGKLLRIFPEEIWLMIFDYLTDSNDLENVSNSSPFFRHCLTPRQTVFLFPKVWELLEAECSQQSKTEYEEALETVGTPDKKCLACGRSRTTRPYSGLLKLRTICKSWTTAMDRFYQNGRPHFKLGEDPKSKEEHPFDWIEEEFMEGDEETECFVKHFKATADRNPFVGREVCLFFTHDDREEDDEEEPEREKISRLLEIFGQYIWYCTIFLEDEDDLSPELYSRLRRWLGCMPEVKTLTIEYCSPSQTEEVDFASEELKAEIFLNGLPPLRNLQLLRTTYIPSVLFKELIKRNKDRLQILEVERNASHKEYDLWSARIPNLEQLSVEIFTEEDFQIWSTSQINWRLNTLCLDFGGKCPFIAWSRIFALFENKWARTLTNLRINFPEAKWTHEEQVILKECSSLRLKLPHLKKLELMLRNITSLDFLLPLKETLEVLDVRVHCNFEQRELDKVALDVEAKQNIQFLGYHKRLYESNIWSALPKLNEIGVSECFDSSTGRDWKIELEGKAKLKEEWECTRRKWKEWQLKDDLVLRKKLTRSCPFL